MYLFYFLKNISFDVVVKYSLNRFRLCSCLSDTTSFLVFYCQNFKGCINTVTIIYIHFKITVVSSSMNFSEVFKQSNQLCKVSPDGKYLVRCFSYSYQHYHMTNQIMARIAYFQTDLNLSY